MRIDSLMGKASNTINSLQEKKCVSFSRTGKIIQALSKRNAKYPGVIPPVRSASERPRQENSKFVQPRQLSDLKKEMKFMQRPWVQSPVLKQTNKLTN